MTKRFSYPWVLVAASFILFVGSFGTQLSFGVFLKPLAEEFGWSRAAVSGAMSLLMGVSGLTGVLMGRLTDRHGQRGVIAAGMVVGTVSYFLLAGMDSLREFYLFFGVGEGFYAGCAYAPVVATLSKWFDARQRTLAIGIALLGIVGGQMVLSPVANWVIETAGWRAAWVVLAVVAFVCGLPVLALSRRIPVVLDGQGMAVKGPADADGLSTRQAAGTASFWMLMITGFVLAVGFYAFTAHIVPYATDVGMSTTVAALILTVSSVGGIPGTLLASPIARRTGYRGALVLFSAVSTAACFLFIFAGSVWSFYLLAIVFSFAFGAAIPVRAAITPLLFGLRSIGTIIGLAALAFSLGGIVGPFLAGLFFDATGSYDLAFLVFGILLAIGVLAVVFLGAAHTRRAGEEAPIWRAEGGLE